MKLLFLFLAWFVLLAISWPLALLALMLAPLLWLLALPFLVLGLVLGALWALLRAVLYLPARLLGHKG